MNADFYLCDVCGAKTKRRFFISVGREMDAAGSMETAGEQVDLCEEHLLGALNYLLFPREGSYAVRPNYTAGQQVLGWIAKTKKWVVK